MELVSFVSCELAAVKDGIEVPVKAKARKAAIEWLSASIGSRPGSLKPIRRYNTVS